MLSLAKIFIDSALQSVVFLAIKYFVDDEFLFAEIFPVRTILTLQKCIVCVSCEVHKTSGKDVCVCECAKFSVVEIVTYVFVVVVEINQIYSVSACTTTAHFLLHYFNLAGSVVIIYAGTWKVL